MHMKKILYSLFILAGAVSAQAQTKEAPRSEFLVELSASAVEAKAGDSKTITVTLNRSKSFSKPKATVGLSSGLPQGVSVTFNPAEGVQESTQATITLDAQAKPGQYTIILNATILGKSKGATLKLVVAEPTAQAVTTSLEEDK